MSDIVCVSQTTSNKPMNRLWIPISYVNKFRCFVSSCFNALNQNCLSLFVPNLQTTVSWSRELHLFLCVLLQLHSKHIFLLFILDATMKHFLSLLLDTLFPLKYIWIKMYKFGEWYVVTSYHCRSYCFFLCSNMMHDDMKRYQYIKCFYMYK